MDVVVFFNRNERTEDHGVKRDERRNHWTPRCTFVPDKVREQTELGVLANQMTEDFGKSRTYWLHRLGVL